MPFINNTKGVEEVKQGTLRGTFVSLNFETINAIHIPPECPPLEIHNNLLPKNEQVQTKENSITSHLIYKTSAMESPDS